MHRSFKLIEFNTKDVDGNFVIQIFGINENGNSGSIIINGFKPFFYIKVPPQWTKPRVEEFISYIKLKIGSYFADHISHYKLIDKHNLYGFDNMKMHKFVQIKFNSISAFYKTKNLWYFTHKGDKTLLKNGFIFGSKSENTYIYESNIPPLLRYFHIHSISPSGWIAVPKNKAIRKEYKKTYCDFEFNINYSDVIPLPHKETPVPYNIASYDIEASSSHGDFPLAVKDYSKLANNIIDYIDKENSSVSIKHIIMTAFGYSSHDNIDLVYPKVMPSKDDITIMCNKFIETPIEMGSSNNIYTIQETIQKSAHTKTILDIITNRNNKRETKLTHINKALCGVFPKLKGDIVTFIGTTFVKQGQDKPHLKHCIVLDTCDKLPENAVIESYSTEKEVLLAWTSLIQREQPDITIGYNTSGFDDSFMFARALENNCTSDFLLMSRNIDELCADIDYRTKQIRIKESSIVIASGQHDLRYIDMTGRLNIDLYNYFRRNANLTSYKLDYVSGHYIGDKITGMKSLHNGDTTLIKSKNLSGLNIDAFVHIELINHTTEYYKNGAKFRVTSIKDDESFIIHTGEDIKIVEDLGSIDGSIRWCIAKDDISPQDIFRLTGEGPYERAIVAKYCIQDCNLVQELFKKIDIMTEISEMAKLCSIPMSFVVTRGQGIKLTSYLAKKCREKNTLMPVIEKTENDDAYEGATVLDPQKGLYLEDPVACVDYGSLYPSSIISENICLSSKVWTKQYDLDGNLISEKGEMDTDNNYIYDNIPGYNYINIGPFNTYAYRKKTPNGAKHKIKTGTKVCRFAQYPNNKRAILPSILEELLSERKRNKKLAKETTDPFMKNILDKRQLSIKLAANSVYGQSGSKTSTFYDPDIAASTTATGRLLLIYAKKMIEGVYGENICETSYGKVKTNARYIYGDTDSIFFCFYLQELDGTPIKGKRALAITIELSKKVSQIASSFLKYPHDLEYEKTFLPFCLLSKKRYFGILYEDDIEKGYRKGMGIVLKRRDNAPIVKDIYGGIINIIMNERSISGAITFLDNCLKDIVSHKTHMDKLIISKSLRSGYKNPDQIAHNVLAKRIALRDPGNTPSNGDRIPYVFIQTGLKKGLQGDRIETPSYVIENKLQIDYAHYISNQIMVPVQQIFAIILEDIPSFKLKLMKYRRFKKQIESLRKNYTGEELDKKEEKIRNSEVKTLLFQKYLSTPTNKNTMNNYF